MSDESSFFGGMDLLDGMPLRRAGAILFAIEGRTAHLVEQSRQALTPYTGEKTAAEKEQAFLAAIAHGRDLPLQPTIQDIERYAPEWSSLVPSDDTQRAALAKKLAEKYHFRRKNVPAMRMALGLDTDRVKQAHERLFHEPLDAIYSSSSPLSEQIRWQTSRTADKLERLPPIWIAFFLTLTETVGASILALPIALAGVGPIPGAILLFILGLVNIITIIGIVEAVTRNGNIRYGTTFFSRLVDDYLGKTGRNILVPAFFIINALSLIALYTGISTSLADITGVNAMLWAMVVFLIAIYFLRRETLNATIASAIVMGTINILIIIVLSLLALTYIRSENLQYINLPFTDGQPFDPAILNLVFGVVLLSFFGHTTAVSAAKVVLPRDPSGKSLIWGNIVAMATVVVLYCLWVIAIIGAISAPKLSAITGTALSPLAEKIGGIVPFLGLIYIILAMGIGLVLFSFGMIFQIREFLPSNMKSSYQFLLSLSPIILLFIYVEWTLYTERASFSEILGITGALLVPILGGIFPMMLLAASRRKGEYIPDPSFSFLGNPLVLAVVYLIYLGSIFVYGFFVWENPYQRVTAIGVGVMILIVTILVIRQGLFESRVVIELRVEESDTRERALMTIVDRGKPLVGTFRFIYADGEETRSGTEIEIPSFRQLRNIFIEFSSKSSKELKVWLHRVTPEGHSEPIPAAVNINDGSNGAEIQLDSNTSQIILPLTSQLKELEIIL